MPEETLSETTLIWLFGVMGVWLVALTTLGIGLIISQVKTNFAVNLFIGTLGDKIGKALHDDDNHLKLDELIDKLTHGDKQEADYFEMKNQCNYLLGDKSVTKDERVGAATMAAVCEWILITRFGKTKENV